MERYIVAPSPFCDPFPKSTYGVRKCSGYRTKTDLKNNICSRHCNSVYDYGVDHFLCCGD